MCMGYMQSMLAATGWSCKDRIVIGLAALTLIAATWALHIRLLLWDHIDLVPICRAWLAHDLSASRFWNVHGGSHLHVSAYAVLLITTWLSHGQTWLDCLTSALLMTGTAVLLLGLARRILPQGMGRGWWFVIGLLAFYPGHLINLQWGWQVAVFISLLGIAAPICLLSAPGLERTDNGATGCTVGSDVLRYHAGGVSDGNRAVVAAEMEYAASHH